MYYCFMCQFFSGCFFFSCQIEVESKYKNLLCGLCGDFNGSPNDILRDGTICSVLWYKSPHTRQHK